MRKVLTQANEYTVYVCRSGRTFSVKLAEIHDQVKADCTPILACIDVGSHKKNEVLTRARPKFFPESDSPLPSPTVLRRGFTFSSENDESSGLQLLSRIASDLQVDEGVKLIIPVAVVQQHRKDSHDHSIQLQSARSDVARAPYGSETEPTQLADSSDAIDSQLMLQCLDAGALDVVKSPLDKAGIMGLTVHAYRIYKSAKAEDSHYMSKARGRSRKQSWVGVDEEKPYAYLREAMVRKLLKGICDPQDVIEDYQHRQLFIEPRRKPIIAEEIGKWSFSAQDFTDDELVYAGYLMLSHALKMKEVEKWRVEKGNNSRTHVKSSSNTLQMIWSVSCKAVESLTILLCFITTSNMLWMYFNQHFIFWFRSAIYHHIRGEQILPNMPTINHLLRN